MSIKIISFLVSFSFFIVISLLIFFLFSYTSTEYYIRLKKDEIRSYGKILKDELEGTDILTLNKDYIFFNVAMHLPEYSYFIIFDKDYSVVFYFPHYFEVDKDFIRKAEFGKETIIVDTDEFIISYFFPLISTRNEYMIALELDLSVIKDFRKNLMRYSLYFSPVLFLFALLTSFIISSIIQKRLKIIRDFVVKVALGNLNYNIEYKQKDEMEDVFRSIKIMRNNLISLLKEVENSKNNLQNILSSLPFTVFLIDKNNKTQVFTNNYNIPIDQFKTKLSEEIVDYGDKKFKNIVINLEKGKLVIVLDFTEIYEIERMKIKFLSEISHDLRTPIAVAKSIILNIKHSPEEVNKAVEYLDKISSMINRYLYYSKIKLRKIRLNIIRISLEELIQLIDDTITFFAQNIEVNFPTSVPQEKLELDIELFQQMFFNIVDNAVKNSEEVKVDFHLFDRYVEISIKNRAKYSDYELVKEVLSELKDTKGLGLNIIKEISLINRTPIDVLYERDQIVFKIQIKYVSDSLQNR
ncbi:MAG: hypothetical protein N2657_03660 [bacterium]|nr:hypothetical protein [bacterium]